MAPESRESDLAVTETALEARLAERPFEFEFFQAVRLLQRLAEGVQPVGKFGDPSKEAVRFAAHPSLAFPASEIQSLTRQDEQPPLMVVNFFGLTGPVSVLPVVYTALIIERLYAHDPTLRDFFDIFNHRLLSLFYRAWEKYRFVAPYERGEDDRFTHYLLDLIGLGTPGLQNRQAVRDQSLAYYTGLLGQYPRSTAALEQILSDYFEVPVKVEPFAGTWRRLDASSRSCLLESGARSEQLGIGTVLGDEVWDQQSVIRIHLGPLTLAQYKDFLPRGTAYEPLRSLTQFFCGHDLDVEVKLILKRQEVPRCGLGVEEAPAPQLGWISWMFSRPLDRDPDDTVLRLWSDSTEPRP